MSRMLCLNGVAVLRRKREEYYNWDQSIVVGALGSRPIICNTGWSTAEGILLFAYKSGERDAFFILIIGGIGTILSMSFIHCKSG